ncbi:hypothetical protein BOTBODRAFT_187320 [Botryobasidium botryosum FD-172 SS1]|uniref:Uncharacterized protein n=1 Tax=Botryobasidium botryosum (strain FD-172 SS1) TaxID=930990 RepID=A0A067MIY9_BOTB1|nr:hypothetical protein BOTBODRAFT_187320 [Botryobasidium botryosum FD-172 SS1]
MEKATSKHAPAVPPPSPSQSWRTSPHIGRAFTVILLVGLALTPLKLLDFHPARVVSEDHGICAQETPLVPSTHSALFQALGELYDTPQFKETAAEKLGGAVRVPTESFDDMTAVGTDSRWDVFGDLHHYLRVAFPRVHETLEITAVNTYGLTYRWQGSDASLKPILLVAHQDVVPVDQATVSEWLHAPFSGDYDGKWIWGRGSADNKNGLIGILSSIENLIERGFKPRRPIVLAFGFDEEIHGLHGAAEIAAHLLREYGKDSFAILVDEGTGYSQENGAFFAKPAVAEKGYLDLTISISTAGGHSSVPPPHTSIGILALVITHLESRPYPSRLIRDSPAYETIQCIAAHAGELPDDLRSDIIRSVTSTRALKRVEQAIFHGSQGDFYRSLFGTTQAVDIIAGGVKVNALPERANVAINHRVASDSSTSAVMSHLTAELKPIAERFNLAFTVLGANITSPHSSAGTLDISDPSHSRLDPSPVTSTKEAAWRLLAGTIRGTHATGRGRASGEELFVAPSLDGANTDTRHYWDLTRNIFRYGHSDRNVDRRNGVIHTVNEAQGADGFVEMIRFFTTLILNADESNEL